MTTPERFQIARSIAAILLCGVVAASCITLTRTVNLTLLSLNRPGGLLDVAQNAPQTLAKLGDAADGLKRTTDAATGLLRAAMPVVSGLQTTEGRLNDAIDLTNHRLNDLCPAASDVARPCGTLADTNRTLATFRGTSGQVEVSLRRFNQHEDDLFSQEREAYAMMNQSVTDFDKLVSDPSLPALFLNARTITGDTAAMTTDGRTWVHQKLFPTKKRGFLTGFEATGDAVKHWLPPLF